jgi:hypothetical protein
MVFKPQVDSLKAAAWTAYARRQMGETSEGKRVLDYIEKNYVSKDVRNAKVDKVFNFMESLNIIGARIAYRQALHDANEGQIGKLIDDKLVVSTPTWFLNQQYHGQQQICFNPKESAVYKYFMDVAENGHTSNETYDQRMNAVRRAMQLRH